MSTSTGETGARGAAEAKGPPVGREPASERGSAGVAVNGWWAGDLVVVTIPGVQQFIGEARTTADLYAASRIMSLLTARMAAVAAELGTLVLPAIPPLSVPDELGQAGMTEQSAAGLPNRAVAFTEAGGGGRLARAMSAAVVDTWAELVAAGSGDGATIAPTPGFPVPQWAVAPGARWATYQEDLGRAMRALANRKKTRDFPGYRVRTPAVCGLSGRWAATGRDPRTGEELSAAARAKRSFRDTLGGFPSTPSVASAVYRARIVELLPSTPELRVAVAKLRDAVEALLREDAGHGDAGRARNHLVRGNSDLPGLRELGKRAGERWLAQAEGAWVYPDTWDEQSLRRDFRLDYVPDKDLCDAGRLAAQTLSRRAVEAGVDPLTPYLALVVQDADRMGAALSEPPPTVEDVAGWHGSVSRTLVDIGGRQSVQVARRDLLGRAVYAGGDDLMCFVPAATAITAALRMNAEFVDSAAREIAHGVSLTASTAVVYFHASAALQGVVQTANDLLKAAKTRDRPGLGVAVLRRGGERARVVVPWHAPGGRTSLGAIAHLVAAYGEGLSPRLASRLETDREVLALLPERWREREIGRLAGRQHAPADVVHLLSTWTDRDAPSGLATDVALVARFIAAETRRSPAAAPTGGVATTGGVAAAGSGAR